MADFDSTYHPTAVHLTPITDAARLWCHDNLSGETMCFGPSVLIEPDYFPDVAMGILDDGLSIRDTVTGNLASRPAYH